MRSTALLDALRPIAARMPKAVREHEIMRVSADIRTDDPHKVADRARKEVLAWAQKRSGGRFPELAWKSESFEYFSGGRDNIGVRINDDGIDIWALRTNDPDKSVPGRIWTTEIVIAETVGNSVKFATRLLANTPEDAPEIIPHVPGFVTQVSENCGLWCGTFEASSNPIWIETVGGAAKLVEMLLSENRKIPVFVLTVSESSEIPRPYILPMDLARSTAGIAHVVVLPQAFTWVLTDRLGKQRSVFGGAVRAYLPGFSIDSDPYAHRLVLADALLHTNGQTQCANWMRSLAAAESVRRNRLGREILAFGEVRNVSTQLRLKKLVKEGATDAQKLEVAEARIDALEAQISDEKDTSDYFATEHAEAVERAVEAEARLGQATYKIQTLIEQLRLAGRGPDSVPILPNRWEGFTEWCDSMLVGKVVLSSTARRGVRNPEFTEVELAARCLLWLAGPARDRWLSGGDGSFAEEVVEDGIRNSHCGSDCFNVVWQGQRYMADWHIKSGGNTRDPARCLRIYYFWEQSTQQIVVADMPAHRRTGAS